MQDINVKLELFLVQLNLHFTTMFDATEASHRPNDPI
jgi:hypothetical protein